MIPSLACPAPTVPAVLACGADGAYLARAFGPTTRHSAKLLQPSPCNPATLQPEPEPEPGKSLQRLWDAARPQFVDAATGEVRPGLDLLRAA